ncbi:hypothetical protein OFC47_26035, partial [Escherichia coli]|nr:hypothetical protein [Escherichia coli]
ASAELDVKKLQELDIPQMSLGTGLYRVLKTCPEHVVHQTKQNSLGGRDNVFGNTQRLPRKWDQSTVVDGFDNLSGKLENERLLTLFKDATANEVLTQQTP